MKLLSLAAPVAVLAAAVLAVATPARADLIFLSNQLRPIAEAEKVRQVILRGAPDKVDFVVDEPGPWAARIKAEAQSGSVKTGLLGGLHGDFAAVANALQPLDELTSKLASQKIDPTYLTLAKMGGEHPLYIPWMQATYIMVANKKALPYLPQGATLDTLTYAQLAAWGEAIEKATGERKLGFPAGPKGLIHRLIEGSLYPSYTGGIVRPFKSAEAVQGWEEFRHIWKSTNPRSTSFDFMQEPLLSGDVWVAFDHVARVLDALNKQPDEFVAFPAPSGPKGLGYMPVVAGLAIPKGSPSQAEAANVIQYLSQPQAQIATLRETGFFPVIQVELPKELGAGLNLANAAVQKQVAAKNGLVSLLPVGLGEKEGEFNKLFIDTFQLIVIRGRDIKPTLDSQATRLEAILKSAKAACWEPDKPSEGPCPVE